MKIQTKGKTAEELVPELGAEYRRQMIATMAKIWGDRPSNATKIDPRRELGLWLQPTSPAAVEAIKMQARPEEIEQANRLWAQQRKAEGATDEQVFQECRKYAYQLGKQAAQGDPEKEAAYHEKMAARAIEYRLHGIPPREMPGLGASGASHRDSLRTPAPVAA